MLRSLGKVTIPNAGTPVQATVNQSDPAQVFLCHAFLVESWPTNVGKIYVGLKNMDKSSGSNLLAVLAIPTTNSIPTFSATIAAAPNALSINDIYIDADTSNDSALVSVVIT